MGVVTNCSLRFRFQLEELTTFVYFLLTIAASLGLNQFMVLS